jgi:hypothetical protein
VKKKLLLPLLLISLVALVLLSIFTAGDNHVEVVGENVSLAEQNTQLKTENGSLKAENNQLVAKNEALSEQVVEMSSTLDSVSSLPVEKPIEVKVQSRIDTKYGWADPEYVWNLLSYELNRDPTKQEYRTSLLEALNNNALYYSSESDPELRGIAVKRSEIDSLIKLKY